MKTTHCVSGRVTLCPRHILFSLLVLLALGGSLDARERHARGGKSKPQATQAEATTGPRIWLADAQHLRVSHVAARPSAKLVAQSLAAGQGQPLAMINGDFDGDGVEDLVVGYATAGGGALVLHRGNLDAFAPQSEASFQAIAHGQFPSPFVEKAQVIDVPVRPDFIATGNFAGNGNQDLAVAQRGGSTLYILPGDGKGKFGSPQQVSLQGGVTAMAAGALGGGHLLTDLVVGVSNAAKSTLLILGDTGLGLGAIASYPLAGPASNILFGEFGESGQDVAFLADGQIKILRSENMQIETAELPVSVSAFALGSFIFDRSGGSQIAAVAPDGSVRVAVRNEFDPRPYSNEEFRAIRHARLNNQPLPAFYPARTFPSSGWQIVESFPGAARVGNGETPVVFRTRVSINGADDVMVLSADSGQLTLISHPDSQPLASSFVPGQVSQRPYTGTPLAALPMRVNVDGRLGVVALHKGETFPSLIHPIPDPTFTVNRTDDPTPVFPITNACNGVANDCSLREAILRANGDTVMVPSGTYTLTIPKVANDCTGNFGALSVDRTTTIVGAGQNLTIIQAGTVAYSAGTPNGVDMVMNVNEDLSTPNCPVTNASASLSNLTLQNGHNRGTHSNDGDGGCMEFDTGLSGNATLTLTNVTLQNCDTTQGNGGGLANFNFVVNGPGLATISNSIIQGNRGSDSVVSGGSSGGGIFVSDPSRILMTNSQVINNQAGTGSGVGNGGGLRIFSNVSGSRQTVIHSCTIAGNSATGEGGGIWASSNLLIDQSSLISGNTGGTGNIVNQRDGGGLFLNTKNPDSVTLTKVTITGNHAPNGNGGGISDGNLSAGFGTLTMSFSRIEGNTAGGSGSNLNNIDGTVTVTNNWWGTNTPATTIRNDAGGATPSTATFDPFIVLTHTASPNKIKINASATLTGDMSKDNHGNGAALSGNLDEIVGLPVTFNNPNLGSIPQAQPETLGNPVPTATATFNAGGVGGNGSADATVDQQAVTATIIILQPPSITATFGPKTIQTTTGTGTKVSTITFSIVNPNTVAINASFTDNLPTSVGTVPGSLVVASTPNIVNACGGSASATAGGGSISFTNATLAVGACTVKVDVQSAVDNIYSNSVTIDSTDAGNGNTTTDTLTVINPPHVVKSFGLSSLPFGATTSLTITVSNPNQNQTLNGIAFTDTLPTAAPGTLIVATPSGLGSTCTGTASGSAGSGSVSLAGASMAPGGSCTVSANVQGTRIGAANNSVTVSDTAAGTGNTGTAALTVIKSDTATQVTSSVNPSVFGQSVTFTATVSPTAPGTGTATGTVTYLDGGSPIGTGTLVGGIATFTTSALSIGNHTITTSYGGDGNFNGNTGSLLGNPQVVNKASTSTTVTSSVIPSLFGQSVTFTATVSPTAPGAGTATGTVTYLDGGSPIGTGTLSGGIATFTTSALAVGNHTITTSYGGDGNFNGSTGSLTGNPQIVNKSNAFTMVTSSVNPSVFGQAVTFTVTISPVAPGSGTPTGTVTYLDGGSPIGSGTLSGGVATFTTSALASGNHTITTSYGGDGNFNGTTGSLTGNPQVVNKTNSATAVTSSVNPSVFGQSVTFTATVSPVAPGAGTPTGTVTYLDGGSPIGTGTLAGGIATFTTSALASGNHTITTSYGGDGNFNGSTGSLTGNPQVVNKTNSTTTVTSSANPSVFGQVVTFTATVSPVGPGAGTPTGTVTYLDGGSPIGTGTLTGGIATFTTSALSIGNHTITTSYGGDGNFNGSTGSLTRNPQVVNKTDSSTFVTSSVNPSVFGQSVTFTATISPVAPGAGTPTGTVTYLDGGSPIGTGNLVGGIATFTTSALSIGNHTITTSYGGDGNFNGSTGALTGNPQVVNKADTAQAVVSSNNPQSAGQPVTFTAVVSAVAPGSGTPTGTVTFLDGGSPFGTGILIGGVATFTTSALTPGNHTIVSIYGGDGNFNSSTGSLTGNPQVVTQAATTTTVTSSAGTITLGDTVTFTATVTAASGTATGLVTFFDGITPLGSGTLQTVGGNQQASISTALLSAAGSPHSITATYQGLTAFAASTSSAIAETVNPRTSSTGVVQNPSTVVVGQVSATTVTATDSGSVPSGTADTFSATGAPATGRSGFTATVFGDGLALVAGGTDANNNVLNSAEIYNASNGTFSTTVNLNTARTGAVAVLLPNGKVLVAGGSGNGLATGALNTAELFDPSAGTFAVAGTGSANAMTAARFGASVTLLATGKVLIAGGANSGGVLNSAELYDPTTDAFTATGNPNSARSGASAALLGTGKVLIVGGSSDGTANGALNSAELFDPAGNSGAGTFTAVAGSTPVLAAGRWLPEAALLLSGKVLIAGGENSGGVLASADLYDPVADSFTPSSHSMSQARASGSAVALPSGMVLLAGGTTSQAVDLYDADGDKFNSTGSLRLSNTGLVSTLLNNGQVLEVGLTTTATPASDAELYSPSFNPLGTVNFTSNDAAESFGSACVLTPTTSTASTCTSTITPGEVGVSPHTITGIYPADAVHSGSNNTASLTVNKSDSSTAVLSSVDPSALGQPVTFTATVSPVAPGFGTPTGTVTFLDGGSPIGFGTLNGGIAAFTTSALTTGNHTITTSYGGDGNFNGSTGLLTGNPQMVTKGPATTTVTSSRNPQAFGQSVTFTATVVAAPPGSGTPTGTVTFLDGGSPIGTGTLSGGTVTFTTSALAAGNHTITANYSGDANFTGSTGSLTGNPQVIVAPPAIAKVFNPASIAPNTTTSLTFTISNPAVNTIALGGVAFTDTLPTGLTVASASSTVCGGTLTSTAPTGIVLAGATINSASSCQFSVTVTGVTAGTYTNTTGNVTSTNGGTGNTASANLVVGMPPAITATFGAASIGLGASTSLSFTINNPNASLAFTGVAFTDALPAGLTISTPNGLTGTCGTGTISATAGSSSVTLAGGTIAAGGSCTFSVNVTGFVAGKQVDTTGTVSATNGGTGNTATVSVTVLAPDLTIAKSHTGNFFQGQTGATYAVTVSNAGQGPTLGTVTVTEAPPSAFTVTALEGSGWTCNPAALSCTRSDALAAGASYPAITVTVSVAANAPGTATNTVTVSGGGELNVANDTATDLTTITAPPDFTLVFAPTTLTVKAGQDASYTLTISSTNNVFSNAINLTATGLPPKTQFAFNPPSVTPGANSASSTLTVITTAGDPFVAKNSRNSMPLYAMLLPFAGLLFSGLGMSKREWRKGRAGMALMSLMLLCGGLALNGCASAGNFRKLGTPAGTYTITVTATSGATRHSAPVTLIVRP
ncbi:MAG TPA: Ig-like domain repeat protein [Candidatus Acidoferrum sp.]|nr:Ig-like domain repeat protein [Candidatus Acidoferrum sp.]